MTQKVQYPCPKQNVNDFYEKYDVNIIDITRIITDTKHFVVVGVMILNDNARHKKHRNDKVHVCGCTPVVKYRQFKNGHVAL